MLLKNTTILVLLFSPYVSFSQREVTPAYGDSLFIKQMLDRGAALATKTDAACLPVLDSVIQLTEKEKTRYQKFAYIEALRNKSSFYIIVGKYDAANELLNKALQEATVNNIPELIARVNVSLGIVADHQSDYERSVSRNMAALMYYEKQKDSLGVFLVAGNIGNTYIRLEQYDKAIASIERAISIGNNLPGKKIGLANCMNNLARAYKAIGNKQKELEFKLKAYAIFDKEKYKKGLATVSMNLGNYYEKDNQLNESFRYYNIALANSWAIGEQGNIAILYNNMSDLYIKTNDLDKALRCADSGAYYSAKSGNKLVYRDALEAKANILNLQGKHEQAYILHKQFAALNDSIFNSRMQQKVADMEVSYETEKKQAKILALQQDNTIQNLQLKNQEEALDANKYMIASQQLQLLNDSLVIQNQDDSISIQQQTLALQRQKVEELDQQAKIRQLEVQNSQLEVKQKNQLLLLLGIVSLLALMAGYLYYRRFKNKKEQQLKDAFTEQQNLATKALFEGEQKERIRIARDLHDSIGQMLSVVKMQLSTLHSSANDEKKQLSENSLSLVDKTITEVRSISHNLIPEELKFGLVKAIDELCSNISNAGQTEVNFHYDEAAAQLKLSKQTELSVYRIVQEVLGNMAKHSGATQIDAGIHIQQNKISLQLKDNGKGFDTSTISQSKGLGWKNIMARVNLLNGDMQLQSGKTTGTQIEITIPNEHLK